MKRVAIIFIAFISMNVFASGVEVPVEIENTFNAHYPHSENVCWSTSGNEYVADFYLDKHEAKAHFSSTGAITEVDVVVHWTQVPQPARMYIYKHHHVFGLEECDVVEHNGKADGYKISFVSKGQSMVQYFDVTGKPL